MSTVQNFFEKVPKDEVESIFKKGIFEKGQLTLEDGKKNLVIKVKLAVTGQDRFGRLYVIPQDVYELKDRVCAFSFRIGTRIFFFKSKIQIDGKGFHVDVGFDLIELRRRRHVRFDIPENFQYEAVIISQVYKNLRINAQLINFSASGAKIKCKESLTAILKGSTIVLSVKVERRPTFMTACQVRFIFRKQISQPEIGLEFITPDSLTQNKIISLCEDLSRLHLQKIKSVK